MLRNAFSAGSSGCSCSSSCRLSSGWLEPQARDWKCTTKRPPGACPASQGDQTPRGAAGADDPQTLCFSCEGIKAKGLLFSGSLLRDASSSWCFVVNQLLHQDILRIGWDSAKGNLGLSWFACGGCGWGGASASAQVVRAWLPGWLLDGQTGTFPLYTSPWEQLTWMYPTIDTTPPLAPPHHGCSRW